MQLQQQLLALQQRRPLGLHRPSRLLRPCAAAATSEGPHVVPHVGEHGLKQGLGPAQWVLHDGVGVRLACSGGAEQEQEQEQSCCVRRVTPIVRLLPPPRKTVAAAGTPAAARVAAKATEADAGTHASADPWKSETGGMRAGSSGGKAPEDARCAAAAAAVGAPPPPAPAAAAAAHAANQTCGL